MFPDPFDDGMSGGLIVAALYVEVVEQGLEDQRCQEGHPSFQQVDERRVGAELLEDLLGKAPGGNNTAAPNPLSAVLKSGELQSFGIGSDGRRSW